MRVWKMCVFKDVNLKKTYPYFIILSFYSIYKYLSFMCTFPTYYILQRWTRIIVFKLVSKCLCCSFVVCACIYKRAFELFFNLFSGSFFLFFFIFIYDLHDTITSIVAFFSSSSFFCHTYMNVVDHHRRRCRTSNYPA